MIGLLAGNAQAGLVEECSRAFRKKDPAVRVGALQDAGRLVAEADDKSRNKAASSVARGLKDEPVTNVRLSGVNVRSMTMLACPSSVATGSYVAVSHSVTMPSWLPEVARDVPSGE